MPELFFIQNIQESTTDKETYIVNWLRFTVSNGSISSAFSIQTGHQQQEITESPIPLSELQQSYFVIDLEHPNKKCFLEIQPLTNDNTQPRLLRFLSDSSNQYYTLGESLVPKIFEIPRWIEYSSKGQYFKTTSTPNTFPSSLQLTEQNSSKLYEQYAIVRRPHYNKYYLTDFARNNRFPMNYYTINDVIKGDIGHFEKNMTSSEFKSNCENIWDLHEERYMCREDTNYTIIYAYEKEQLPPKVIGEIQFYIEMAFYYYCENNGRPVEPYMMEVLDKFKPIDLWQYFIYVSTLKNVRIIENSTWLTCFLAKLKIGQSDGISIKDIWQFFLGVQVYQDREIIYCILIDSAQKNSDSFNALLNVLKIGQSGGVPFYAFWTCLQKLLTLNFDNQSTLSHILLGHSESRKKLLQILDIGNRISAEDFFQCLTREEKRIDNYGTRVVFSYIIELNIEAWKDIVTSLKMGAPEGLSYDRLCHFLLSEGRSQRYQLIDFGFDQFEKVSNVSLTYFDELINILKIGKPHGLSYENFAEMLNIQNASHATRPPILNLANYPELFSHTLKAFHLQESDGMSIKQFWGKLKPLTIFSILLAKVESIECFIDSLKVGEENGLPIESFKKAIEDRKKCCILPLPESIQKRVKFLYTKAAIDQRIHTGMQRFSWRPSFTYDYAIAQEKRNALEALQKQLRAVSYTDNTENFSDVLNHWKDENSAFQENDKVLSNAQLLSKQRGYIKKPTSSSMDLLDKLSQLKIK